MIQGPVNLYAQAQTYQSFIYQLVPIDGESGDIVYLAVVPVRGASRTQLYNRAHHFMTHTLRTGSLLPMAHGAKHHINRCGIITLQHAQAGSTTPQDYRVTVELRVKAGRYRYRLSQFRAQRDSVGHGLPIRELYQCDKKTYAYDESTAQQLRTWDRSVKAYLGQLHKYMTDSQETDYYRPL
ncbi:DUF4468 domain-containing protein [Spirosoma pollinicola]|uniref:DUF4468 domain-containing protein n=1 Tax=Spirosoma pollinicola TaxID=2057025 RepID=UPI0012FE1828|nr:DUF4468 domain-containing protein [Spirosoma pollinicola]